VVTVARRILRWIRRRPAACTVCRDNHTAERVEPQLNSTDEAILRQSEAKFRALAEASPAAIFIAQHGSISYANPALAALTEYARGELIGLDPVRLLHPSERGHDFDPRREVRVHTRSGHERWIDLAVAPIVYEGGAAVVGTGIDITDRKRLEERMRQGQRLEAVGRLAGGVAHDFNNLLLIITAETEQIAGSLSPDDTLRASADAIAQAAARAALLTEQLLAFGRRQLLIARTVDVNEVVLEFEGMLRDGSREPLPTITHLTPDLPSVRVDRGRIEQVLVNLAANAREAMGNRGSLTITTDLVDIDRAMQAGRPWLPGGTWVRVRVEDTGPGIPPDVMPRVFEPFFSTKAGGPGIGLGLSAVYGIVKQSGGYVWIESEPGAGARVVILLPAAQVPRASGAPAAEAPAVEPRVLLVDDEDGVRDVLTTILARDGFVVRSAATAEAALEMVADASFDVLLTDVVLPGMSGPELASHVRGRDPRTRVLFMSGYTGDAVLDDAEFGEAPAFIQKPFGSRALLDRLRSLLAESAPPAEMSTFVVRD
jgi:two-component system cell cycle sensor histidine kinase/response regulator CckA